jgi:hypothetical protein
MNYQLVHASIVTNQHQKGVEFHVTVGGASVHQTNSMEVETISFEVNSNGYVPFWQPTEDLLIKYIKTDRL